MRSCGCGWAGLYECLGPGVREYDGDAEQGEHAGLGLEMEVDKEDYIDDNR